MQAPKTGGENTFERISERTQTVAPMESLPSTAYLRQTTFSIRAVVLEMQRTKFGALGLYFGPVYYWPTVIACPQNRDCGPKRLLFYFGPFYYGGP